MITTPVYDRATRRIAVFVGLMFLTATLTFLTGDVLIHGALPTDGPGASGALVLGVTLHAVCAVAGAAIGWALVPVMARYHPGMASGYAAFRTFEGVAIIGIGVYMLLTTHLINYEPAIYVFTGVAGLMLSHVLLRTGLAPAWLARLGLAGYIAILAVLPLELLGLASLETMPGLLLYVPGGLFELLLPILLIARGFRQPPTITADVATGSPVLAHAR